MDEVGDLQSQIDYDAIEVDNSPPPPTPPPTAKKKKTKREVSAVVQNHLPSPELTGPAEVYWDNHVHVFEFSLSEQLLLTHDPFMKYWESVGGPDAIITDKPWGHLDKDGNREDKEIPESAIPDICKCWHTIQPKNGRVAVRMLARQTYHWMSCLKAAGYKVWKAPIRCTTLRPGIGGGSFPVKQGPRVLGGEWVVAFKVSSFVLTSWFCLFTRAGRARTDGNTQPIPSIPTKPASVASCRFPRPPSSATSTATSCARRR